MRRLRTLALVPAIAAVFMLGATTASADSGTDFVCPVLDPTVGAHNPNAVPIANGDYTVIPAGAMHLDVPDQATNGDGAGAPAGAHASPGDPDYSAIWNNG
jgi:hypothetical protein